MKKNITIVSIAIALIFSFTSCLDLSNDADYEQYLKDVAEYNKNIIEQYRTDSLLIVNYLEENNLPGIVDSLSGIYYHIVKPGSDDKPNLSSIVEVAYKGYLLDGTVFDETKDSITAEFYLETLIGGWQVGLPKIGTNGKIVLYLPSYFGYGTKVSTIIPANSVLVFDIELLNFY